MKGAASPASEASVIAVVVPVRLVSDSLPLASVLPDRDRSAGAASDHVDEADQPLRLDGAGSIGEFGWAGAARAHYWVDPAEDVVGLFMAQYLTGPEETNRVFRSVVYQAMAD